MSLQERSRTPADDAWAIRVKKRAGWKCEWCGLTIAEIKRLGGELHAAHIKPRSEWPDDALDDSNGRSLCTFKDPRHRHPRGIGQGFGCHNSMSGHWGPPTGPTPVRHSSGRLELAGLGLLAASVVLFVVAFKAHGHQSAWFEGAVTTLAVSAPLWWVKRRLLLSSLLLGFGLWVVLLVASAWLRRYASLRPYLIGAPAPTFEGLLLWIIALLALFVASAVTVHIGLRHRFMSRGARGILHGLVRLARRIRYAKEPQHQG